MAMPLSFAVTILIFKLLGVSVNSMTRGGLAVAIGMVVDDAIVDVENVWRRLREKGGAAVPAAQSRPEACTTLDIIATASGEVRNSILYATVLVMLVFMPLLGLEGIEGRLFTPIAIATITSMAASFVVSLTVIPVLCSLLLSWSPGFSRSEDAPHRRMATPQHRDSFVVRAMKWFVERTFLKLALGAPQLVLAVVGMLLVASLMLYPKMGKEFLPAFNEGSATISLAGAPGTSLAHSMRLARPP
jgi:Cu/Ag efflux pump CusA